MPRQKKQAASRPPAAGAAATAARVRRQLTELVEHPTREIAALRAAVQQVAHDLQADHAARLDALAALEARLATQFASQLRGVMERLEAALARLQATTADRQALADLFADLARGVGNSNAGAAS